jgi:hypothetical protein
MNELRANLEKQRITFRQSARIAFDALGADDQVRVADALLQVRQEGTGPTTRLKIMRVRAWSGPFFVLRADASLRVVFLHEPFFTRCWSVRTPAGATHPGSAGDSLRDSNVARPLLRGVGAGDLLGRRRRRSSLTGELCLIRPVGDPPSQDESPDMNSSGR